MSLTFLLWLSITLFLLGFWLWTLLAVYKQRKSWRFYADKKKLRYEAQGFFTSPSLSGVMNGYKISVFASEHSELDSRYDRRLTAVEVTLKTTLPETQMGMASGGMVPIIETLDLAQEFKPVHDDWDDTYVIKTDSPDLIDAYCTPERLNKITALMKIEKCWIVVVFTKEQGLLRLDTPLPLDHPKKLDALLMQLLDAAKILELAKGEDKDLVRIVKNKRDVISPVIDVDDALLGDDIGLELDESDE